MFFVSGDAVKSCGANLPGSPVIAGDDPEERVTVFMVLAGTWSDGTIDDALTAIRLGNSHHGQPYVNRPSWAS
jgi:hypothetical protein